MAKRTRWSSRVPKWYRKEYDAWASRNYPVPPCVEGKHDLRKVQESRSSTLYRCPCNEKWLRDCSARARTWYAGFAG